MEVSFSNSTVWHKWETTSKWVELLLGFELLNASEGSGWQWLHFLHSLLFGLWGWLVWVKQIKTKTPTLFCNSRFWVCLILLTLFSSSIVLKYKLETSINTHESFNWLFKNRCFLLCCRTSFPVFSLLFPAGGILVPVCRGVAKVFPSGFFFFYFVAKHMLEKLHPRMLDGSRKDWLFTKKMSLSKSGRVVCVCGSK